MQSYTSTSGTLVISFPKITCVAMDDLADHTPIFQNYKAVVQHRSIGTAHKSLYTIDSRNKKYKKERGKKTGEVRGRGNGWREGGRRIGTQRGSECALLGVRKKAGMVNAQCQPSSDIHPRHILV